MDSWGDGESPVSTPTSTPSTPNAPTPSRPASREEPKTTEPVSTPTAQPAVDPAKLIEAAVNSTAAAMAKVQQANTPKPEAKPMTDEEFQKRYGIVNYDAKALERLFHKDPAEAAKFLNEMNANAYQAAVRMANDLFQAQLAQAKGTYDPRISAMEQFVAEQREAAANQRFYTAYPDLKDESPMVQEILNAVQARVSSGQLKFKDEAEAFKFVADATNTRISQMREKYGSAPQGAAPGGGQRTPPTRQMASSTSSARPSAAPPRKPTDMESMMSAWDERDRVE